MAAKGPPDLRFGRQSNQPDHNGSAILLIRVLNGRLAGKTESRLDPAGLSVHKFESESGVSPGTCPKPSLFRP